LIHSPSGTCFSCSYYCLALGHPSSAKCIVASMARWQNPHSSMLYPDDHPPIFPARHQFFEVTTNPLVPLNKDAPLLLNQDASFPHEVLAWIGVVLLCTALYWNKCQWSATGTCQWSSEHYKRKRSLKVPKPSTSQLWLRWLTVATTLLFIFQLWLGMTAGALTLLADLGHTGGDVVTYAFGYFAELAKANLSQRSLVSSRTLALLDMAVALVSVAVVLCTSLAAMISALARLRMHAAHAAQEVDWPETDFRHIGPALLSFGCLNMAMNVGLLAMHRCLATEAPNRGSQTSKASPSLRKPISENVSQPPQRRRPISFAPGADGFADMVCVPCKKTPEAETGALPSRQQTAEDRLEWLHMAFHPGCSHGTCNHGHAAASPLTDDKSEEHVTNLNVYGALLHVATDVLRSMIIFVAGILVQIGVLKDAAWADAVCALFVGFFVILGSAAMIRMAIASVCLPSMVPRSPMA